MQRSRRASELAPLILAALAATSCDSASAPSGEISVGLLLSYTGPLAADSINSDRALRMAIEAANAAGGVSGRPLRIVARDTGSDPARSMARTRELIDAGVALMIGPDTNDVASAARNALGDRTLILPSFATSSDVLYKRPSWFVIGAPIGRIACELAAQLRADQRQSPLLIFNPSGYSASIAWTLTNQYGYTKFVLPDGGAPTGATIAQITTSHADAFVLAAAPSSAVSLIYSLLANGTLKDPTRWYLSPTLHSPTFLDLIPTGGMAGARGVAQGQGTGPDTDAFRARFAQRWQDDALDDAYPFYDAGALAALSLQRALIQDKAVPTGTGLSKHIVLVTKPGNPEVPWNQIGDGLERLRRGEEITYVGLSGHLQFDELGETPGATTSWWTIGSNGFDFRASTSDCR
jgi:ABC-type branched-subunit amino acid transport system substrate-binding protein